MASEFDRAQLADNGLCLTQELSSLMREFDADPGKQIQQSRETVAEAVRETGLNPEEMAKLLDELEEADGNKRNKQSDNLDLLGIPAVHEFPDDIETIPATCLDSREEHEATGVGELFPEVCATEQQGRQEGDVQGSRVSMMEDDTIPASPETLLAAVRMNDDGTLAPGRLQFLEDDAEEEEEIPEPGLPSEREAQESGSSAQKNLPDSRELRRRPAGMEGAASAPTAAGDAGEEFSEGSDMEGTELGHVVPLADEPWMAYPEKERDLWERARPRALRREAAELKALKLPTATLNRLMRLNPDMPFRSAEAVEIINYATVLTLQALVRTTLRGRGSSSRVTFEEVKQACVGIRELRFLSPLDATLDVSAMTVPKDMPPQASAVGEPADARGGSNAKDRGRATLAPAPRPGQKQLSAGFFKAAGPAPAPTASAIPGTTAADSAEAEPGPASEETTGDTTPRRGLPVPDAEGAAGGQKRRAPASAEKSKSSSKAPRRAAGEKKPADGPKADKGPGLASFFRRVDGSSTG